MLIANCKLSRKFFLKELKTELYRYVIQYFCKHDVSFISCGVSILENYQLKFDMNKAALISCKNTWIPMSYDLNDPYVFKNALYRIVDMMYNDELILGKSINFETIQYIRNQLQ